MPQHSIDMASDMTPVLGTDIAPPAEIVGRDVVGRAISGIDCGQNVDPSGDLCPGVIPLPDFVSSPPRKRGPRAAA